jgi:outer membrane receptor protein involved in Fe transport
VPQVPITSWTTVDLSASYRFNTLNGTSILLAATNVMNKAPPYVDDPITALHYDGANANALGRVISLQVVAKW